MTENYKKLSIAVSDFIEREIDENLSEHLIEAVRNHPALRHENMVSFLTDFIENDVSGPFQDVDSIVESVVSEWATIEISELNISDALNVATEKYVKNEIEEYYQFSVLLKETIKEQIHLLEDNENNFMNLKDIVKEVASEKIDFNLNEEFDLKDLFKEVIEEKISEDFLLNSHQSLREMVAQATREEFKKLLKPVYKNLKSLYFDIFNR